MQFFSRNLRYFTKSSQKIQFTRMVQIPFYKLSNIQKGNTDDQEPETHPDFQQKIKPPTQSVKTPQEIINEIDKIVKSNKVVLFMKGIPQNPECGYSNYAVQILKFYCNKRNIVFLLEIKDYHYVDILKNSQMREQVKVYSNWPTFPQLYVNGSLVGGCDIMTEMHKDGSLKELLATIK